MPRAHQVCRWVTPLMAALGCITAIAVGRAAEAAVGPDGRLPGVPLTRIAEIKTRSQFADQSMPVRIEGVVTCVATAGNFFLHDGEMGIHVGESDGGKRLQPGDRVSVAGVTRRGAFAPSIEPLEVVASGKGALPEPRRAAFNEVASGTLDGEWLEIAGVVCDVEFEAAVLGAIFNLAIDGRRLRVTIHDAEGIDPERFIDAEVRLRGVASGNFNRQRQLIEPVLRVPGLSFVQVVRPPPEPFATPVVPLSRLLGFSLDAPAPHRVCIRGVVTRRISDRLVYVRDENLGLKVQTRAPIAFSPGDAIEAAGFARMSSGSAVLEGALCRMVRAGPAPAAARVAWSTLLDGGHSADLVTVRARLVDWVAEEDSATLILQAENQLLRAVLGRAQARDLLPARDSIIEATGICVISEMEDRWNYRPTAVMLLLLDPSDLVLIRPPAWWTAERLGRALGAVLLMLLLGFGWVWSLRRQVQRKRAVIEEQARHAASLEERSRIARDLHDTLEQGLTGLSLQLKVVELDCQEVPNRVGEGLETVRQMLRRSRALAHNAIRELRTDDASRRHEPLVAGLQRIAETWRQAGIPGVTVAVPGPAVPLPRETERHMISIVTEAVTNAVKHGRATSIHITLRTTADRVELRVEDNGVGFTPTVGGDTLGGFGLIGLRERAAAIGGKLEVQSSPGGGTRIRVEVPASRAAPSQATVKDRSAGSSTASAPSVP